MITRPSKLRFILAQNAHPWLHSPIITHSQTNSTNNDAMQLIDADKASHGTTIVADFQRHGRGQRGNEWMANAGDSLLMSVITQPSFRIEAQFCFSALVAASIAGALQELEPSLDVQIKWPNDLIVNAKKAGGILIENVLRGNSWMYAVIGVGLNLNQEHFVEELPNAISLRKVRGKVYDRDALVIILRSALLLSLDQPIDVAAIMKKYNDLLFKKDKLQEFIGEKKFTAKIVEVLPDGRMVVITGNGDTAYITHGSVTWKY